MIGPVINPGGSSGQLQHSRKTMLYKLLAAATNLFHEVVGVRDVRKAFG